MLALFEDIRASPDVAALLDNTRRVVHGLGFESFHYGTNGPGGEQFLFAGIDPAAPVLISDFPPAWFDRYRTQRYGEVDPVLRHCLASMIPAVWHRQQRPALPHAKRLVRDARRHGLAGGATWSVFGANGDVALLALTTSRAARAERRNIEQRLGDGCMLLAHVHETVRRLSQRVACALPRVSLTAREQECLRWVSAGKTSWETAMILSIAERTVNFHIEKVNRKLGTHGRAQAVARAMALGLIAP